VTWTPEDLVPRFEKSSGSALNLPPKVAGLSPCAGKEVNLDKSSHKLGLEKETKKAVASIH